MKEECSNCKFWKEGNRLCRRYAPRTIIAAATEAIAYLNDWAKTAKSDWCGEWEVKG